MGGLTDEEVMEILHEHAHQVEVRLPMWEKFNLAYSSKFWEGGDPWGNKIPGSGDASLPIKIQSNRIFGLVQRYTSNLFFRSPAAAVAMPGVLEARTAGRPPNLDGVPAKAAALLNEWLRRSDAQEAGTYALQLALFHGQAGYKLSENPRARRVVDRLGVSVVPWWEALWDDRETSWDQQLYRGHVRYVRADWVRERFGKDAIKDDELVSLPGRFDQERDWHDDRRLKLRHYVRILELYDMTKDLKGTGGSQRVYYVDGTRNPTVRLLDERPLPYPLPNGRPGIPLVPVVVANEPSRPLSGLSTVERLYWFNSELNLLLSIIANALRRDACRYTLVHKGALTPEAIEAIRNARDGDVIELDPKQVGDLSKVFHTFQLPQFGQSLDKYRQWLFDEESATSGVSDIMSGKQGKYLSATEAEFLAGAGEMSALEVGSRLTQSLARLTELACAAFAAHGKPLQVRLPDGSYVKLDPEELDEPWVVDIEDAASTPMRMAKKQTGFLAVQGTLMELTAIASSPQMLPGPNGEQVPNTITEEQRQEARAQISYIITQWDLPEALGWEMVSGMGEEARAVQKVELKKKVDSLLEVKQQAMAAQGPQLPPPTLPTLG